MMSKRHSGGPKEENYEHVLMCLICRSLFDDYDHQPKFLPCHHTFCKDCLREYVKQAGDEIECPSCRKTATIPSAGVVALQTNFYVKYIQSLVYGSGTTNGNVLECDIHPKSKLLYYCKDCSRSVCNQCCDGEGEKCADHKKVPLTTITEEYHQKLDATFSKANGVIEHKKAELEAMMKVLSEEKDKAMRNIDSAFEQHIHTLTRRATLLKNKVIAIYNEHVEKLENDLEEISTAMTCIVSLKEYHEDMVSKGYFMDTQKGIAEIDEVFTNISSRIQPKENHIVFEEKHGIEKYKASAKDLGRVRNSRPTQPRTDPEGNDATPVENVTARAEEFSSPGLDAATGYSPDTEGAVGGSVVRDPFPGIADGCLSSDREPGRRNCCPDDNSPFLDHSEDKPVNHCDGIAEGLASQHNSRLNICGHSLEKLDINSNTPITVPGVVRPKTLTSKSPVAHTLTGSSSSKIFKRPIQNGMIKHPDKSKCTNTKQKLPIGGLHSLHRSDPGPDLYSLTKLSTSQDQPTLALDPEIESLKQTDKMYHHLVYTSYDEEELLKELQCGKVHIDPTRVPELPQKQSSVDDSDSMMTVSSESTLSGNSEDLTISDEQSRL
ncbi:hypothetical protein LSH36_62g01076 [Paralvinella palmiformis]|uniref:Uncharacterized protein n=1 Tax=Paralvinella palmiformis TaxID=53620 RepID=A0AAD9K432_9ANNE|nr:hypothetical protein LSH36_62g01076 [Paralvinella palmiformis]